MNNSIWISLHDNLDTDNDSEDYVECREVPTKPDAANQALVAAAQHNQKQVDRWIDMYIKFYDIQKFYEYNLNM